MSIHISREKSLKKIPSVTQNGSLTPWEDGEVGVLSAHFLPPTH